jgi:phosphatidylglycerophosphate synthase
MTSARSVVNAFSLSRIAFGFLFVIFFQRTVPFLYISIGLCIAALTTDILDGYLARRLGVASIHGRLWDSLGDKAFYVAVVIAYNAHGFLGPLLSWALLVREIALYITRVMYIEKLPRIERIRPWTNWHGYFMYLTIVLGLFRMYVELHGLSVSLHPYIQASAFAALVFGLGSIVSFLKL